MNNNIFVDIANAINTGYLFNGSKLDLLEFFRLLPVDAFGDDIIGNLEKYLRCKFGNNSYIYLNIMEYLDNYNIHTIEKLDINNINYDYVYMDIFVDKRVVNNILKYMEIKKYPKLQIVYSIILYKYINYEIDVDMILNKEELKKSFKVIKG